MEQSQGFKLDVFLTEFEFTTNSQIRIRVQHFQFIKFKNFCSKIVDQKRASHLIDFFEFWNSCYQV